MLCRAYTTSDLLYEPDEIMYLSLEGSKVTR